MPDETQLLGVILDGGSSASERETAVAALKRITGKDRAGLVEKYTHLPTVDMTAAVSREIENFALKLEIGTLKAKKLSAAEHQLEMLTPSRYRHVYEAPPAPKRDPSKHDPPKAKPTGGWETRAPSKLYDKPVKQIDIVAAAYGLELVPATEMPVFPTGYPKWKKASGKLFTTTCPLLPQHDARQHPLSALDMPVRPDIPLSQAALTRRRRPRRAPDRLRLVQCCALRNRHRLPAAAAPSTRLIVFKREEFNRCQ